MNKLETIMGVILLAIILLALLVRIFRLDQAPEYSDWLRECEEALETARWREEPGEKNED